MLPVKPETKEELKKNVCEREREREKEERNSIAGITRFLRRPDEVAAHYSPRRGRGRGRRTAFPYSCF